MFLYLYIFTDIVQITFEQLTYRFEESTENQSVCIVIQSGELGREITVRLSFEDLTAIGMEIIL